MKQFISLSIFALLLSLTGCIKPEQNLVSVNGEPAYSIPGIEANEVIERLYEKGFQTSTDFEKTRSRWMARQKTGSTDLYVLFVGSGDKEVTEIEVSILDETNSWGESAKGVFSYIAGLPIKEGSEWVDANFWIDAEMMFPGLIYELDSSEDFVELKITGVKKQ